MLRGNAPAALIEPVGTDGSSRLPQLALRLLRHQSLSLSVQDGAPARSSLPPWSAPGGCAPDSLSPSRLSPQARRKRHLPPPLGVLRRRHRVLRLEPEPLAILSRRQVVPDREVALQDLLWLTADQAEEVIPLNGAANRHRRLGLLYLGLLGRGADPAELVGNGGDERRHLGRPVSLFETYAETISAVSSAVLAGVAR